MTAPLGEGMIILKTQTFVRNIMPSHIGAVIWRLFPVMAQVLMVELANLPQSRKNGGGFRAGVRSFRSCNAGNTQGILHWISGRRTQGTTL